MPIHSKANIMPILSVQTVCVGEVKWQSLVRQAKDKEEEGEKEEEEKEKKKKQGPFFLFCSQMIKLYSACHGNVSHDVGAHQKKKARLLQSSEQQPTHCFLPVLSIHACSSCHVWAVL